MEVNDDEFAPAMEEPEMMSPEDEDAMMEAAPEPY